MQLICGQCRANYSIADRLLENRPPFRIQCRKCKGFIQVGKVESIFAVESDIPVEVDAGERYELHVASGTQGPFSLDELQQMFTDGMVKPVTPVRAVGESDWRPLDDVLDVKALQKSAGARDTARAPIPISISANSRPREEDLLFGNAPLRATTRPPMRPAADASALASLDQIAKMSAKSARGAQRRMEEASGLIDVFGVASPPARKRTLPEIKIQPALDPVAIPESEAPAPEHVVAPAPAPSASLKSALYTGILVTAIVSACALASFLMIRGSFSSPPPQLPPTAVIVAPSQIPDAPVARPLPPVVPAPAQAVQGPAARPQGRPAPRRPGPR